MEACRKEAYIQDFGCDCPPPAEGEISCGEKAYNALKDLNGHQEVILVQMGALPAAVLFGFIRRAEEICMKRMGMPNNGDPSSN